MAKHHINTHKKFEPGKVYEREKDFPLLAQTGKKFIMWKKNDGWHIQTTIGDFDELVSLIKKGKKHLRKDTIFME